MKISKINLTILLLEVLIIGVSAIIVVITLDAKTWEMFLCLAKFGFMICLIYSVFLWVLQKNLFNIVNLVFLSFWVFQFGLPICYVLNNDYSNFYINLFDIDTLIRGMQYSILSIEVFALALSYMLSRESNRKISVVFADKVWTQNTKFVSNIGVMLFALTALIEIPLVSYAAYATKVYGFFAANTRSFLSSNALYRAIEAFCVPSGLLALIFCESKSMKKIIKFALCLIAVLQLIAGDRTNGLASLLAIAYYQVFGEESIGKRKKSSVLKQTMFGVILCVLLIVLVYVAVARVSSSGVSFWEVVSEGVVGKFLAELGLNFTTICFVMDYIPSIYSYRSGLTYLGAVFCLIPKSLDPTGLINYISSYNPEMWLFNANHNKYGSLLDFGVGFSLIAESYMNFSWFGLFAVFTIGVLIMKFISVDFSKCSRWQKYIQLVLMISLMTFARRSFYDLVKDIEYSIFCIALILYLFYSLSKSKR